MRLLATAILTARAAFAAGSPEFDVASLKPVILDGADTYRANLGYYRNGVVALSNVTLAECLRFAYDITSDDLVAGPEWIKNKYVRFDITGKTDPSKSRAEALLMLRTLLEDRFELKLRKEPRTLSYFALTAPEGAGRLKAIEAPPSEQKTLLRPGHIAHNNITMLMLATLIARFTRMPVVDQTNLPGLYDLTLDWARDTSMPLPNAAPSDAPDGPSISEAVQKQLGLKLEKRKGPIDVLVVDSARQVPKEN
ncbi:MAG: TIGR03435 family protein [Candidatus Solibacter sp.]